MSNNSDTELPQASPGATIEDKLNYILNGINVDGYPEENWFSKTKAELLSLITTETTKAKLYELQRLLPQMTVDEYGLWVRQQIAERIHALQKEQKRKTRTTSEDTYTDINSDGTIKEKHD